MQAEDSTRLDPSDEVWQRWRESEKLVATSRRLSALCDKQAVINLVCKAARDLAESDGACIILREGELVHYSQEEAIAPLWAGQRFPISNCISGWSILNQTPAVIEDIYNDDRIPVEYYRSTFVKSLAMMPVTCEHPIGAIGVYWPRCHRATARQLELLEVLADLVCTALLNIELVEKKDRALEQAEAAGRLKDEFLAVLSHELRTPLNAILGWVSMLRSGGLDPATSARALEVIERNTRIQSELVADLLDVSRIITGKLCLKVEPVELGPVIRRAADSVRVAADAKEIQLQLRVDSSAGRALADASRLQQVVWNLLSNAVKFTPPGGIIKVSLARVDSHLEITVSDTGEGVDAAFLPFMFDRFRQADGSITRRHGGLGLGLALARHMVELHGGSIEAASDGRGLGATFRVRLPAVATTSSQSAGDGGMTDDAPQNHSAGSPAGEVLSGLRVLVVDDDEDACYLFTVMLEKAGATVRAVASASSALEAVERFAPDVILADIAMPGATGYDLLRKVRALPGGRGKPISALAVTALVMEEDRKQALAAGFAAHLAKPVSPDELVGAIVNLMAQKKR